MRWRNKDVQDLKDKWSDTSLSMKDLCTLFCASQASLTHIATSNGLPPRAQIMKAARARKSQQLKRIASNNRRQASGDHDAKEVATRLKNLQDRNSKREPNPTRNNRDKWRTSGRECYKLSVCQWPETWDETHTQLCGSSVSDDGPYCKFHKSFSTKRGLTTIGIADVDYLTEWWEQAY